MIMIRLRFLDRNLGQLNCERPAIHTHEITQRKKHIDLDIRSGNKT